VLAYLIAVARHWLDAKQDIEAQLRYFNSILVQNTRTTLKNYELVLRGLGSELIAQGALHEPSRGRELIERMKAIDPGMAGLGLARPDGQLVLVSGVPDGSPCPICWSSRYRATASSPASVPAISSSAGRTTWRRCSAG